MVKRRTRLASSVNSAIISIRARFMPTQACGRSTETQVIARAPQHIEPIRVGILSLVSVSGALEHDGARAGGQNDAVHVDVPGNVAGEVLDRRVVAQYFVDRARYQPRILTPRSHWSGLFANSHTAL